MSNMILFISMVLVAAIAASVLINTGMSLQNKALFAARRSKEQISVGTQIIQMWGENSLGLKNHTVDIFYMRVKIVPGGSPIKLDDTFIGVDFQSASADLYAVTYNDTFERNCSFTGSLSDSGFWTDNALEKGNYSYQYLIKGSKYQDKYLNEGDVLLVCFKAPYPIGESEKVGIQFIPKPGTATIIESVTPDEILNTRVFLVR